MIPLEIHQTIHCHLTKYKKQVYHLFFNLVQLTIKIIICCQIYKKAEEITHANQLFEILNIWRWTVDGDECTSVVLQYLSSNVLLQSTIHLLFA